MVQRSSFGLGRTVCGLAVGVSCLVPGAARGAVFEKGRVVTVEPLAGERWRGGTTFFGNEQPYGTTRRRDLVNQSYANPCAAFFVSSAGRYVWSDRPFAFAFSNGVLRIDSSLADVHLVRAGTTLREAYRAAAKAHFPPSGRLPDETFFTRPQYNTWIESNLVPNGQGMVEGYADAIVANGYPVGVLMIDDGWAPTNAYGDLRFNRNLFPEPKRMFAKLRDAGFRTMLWTTPYVFHTADFHREASEKGLFLKNTVTGKAYAGTYYPGLPSCGILDLLDRGKWDVLERRYKDFAAEYGFDGYKFDFTDANCLRIKFDKTMPGESLPKDVAPSEYTGAWGRFASRFAFNEMRAGWQYAGLPLVCRLQDKDHSWDDLRKLVPDMLAAGMVGCAYTCPDMIGGGCAGSFRDLGKNAKFDPKLFVRSAQVQALMPMMQFSAAPWRMLSKEANDVCRAAADLHVAFAPEILRLARQAAKTGEPIVRPMEYVFPHQGFDACLQQFMLGDRWLVAPVVSADDSVTVQLPAGRWKDDLGAIHDGPKTLSLKDVPLARLPRFERLSATIVEQGSDETLEALRDRVRTLPESVRATGVEVRLRAGDFEMEDGLVFTKADSGCPGAPVVWRGATEGRTRLFGGRSVPASSFKSDPDRPGVLVADISFMGDGWPERPKREWSRLFHPIPIVTVDGERYVPAGWPDKTASTTNAAQNGWATFTETVNPGTNITDAVGFVYTGTRPERWLNEKDAYLLGYWCHDWALAELALGRIDTEKKAIYPAYKHGYGMRPGNEPPRRWRIHNALSELDRPGECYVDVRAKRLYLVPKRPLTPSTRVLVCRRSNDTVSFRGVSDVEFRDMDLEGSFMSAVGASGLTNVVLRGLSVRNARKFALNLCDASGCAVLDCEIGPTGAGGVSLSGGDRKRLVRGDNVIENCLIHDFSTIKETNSQAIETHGCGNVARHNEIYNTPHMAVSMWGNDNLFEYNVVSNAVLSTDDAGAYYVGRDPSEQGNVLRYNLFSDIGRDTVWRNAAVYFDDGECGYDVYGCVFRRCRATGGGRFGAVLCHGGHSNVVRNCLFVDCARAVGTIPWDQKRWEEFLVSPRQRKQLKEDVDVESARCLEHYPFMKDFLRGMSDATRKQYVCDCVVVNCKKGLAAGENWTSNACNAVVGALPPGDVNAACRSLVKGFNPIPFERIGRRGAPHVTMSLPDLFEPGSTVLFQGDSITSGFRAGDLNGPYGQCYVGEIAAHYQAEHPQDRVEFANRGVSGDTSSNLVARWSTDAFPYTVAENGYEGAFGRKKGAKVVPDYLSVLVGINDYYYSKKGDPRAVSCEQYEANLRKMIVDARTMNPAVKIALCEPFRIPVDATPDFCRRQDVVAKLAVEYDCAFVPFQKLFGEDLLRKNGNPRYWFWDFFHATPAGHVEMARFWTGSVRRHQMRAARNTALEPRAKIEDDSYDWFERHRKIVTDQKALDPEIVFIGDSITHGWDADDKLRGNAKAVFDKWFGKRRPLNMGFGWDRIQNVLWRLSHGEMDGTNPKSVVILIGTNNTAPGYKRPFPANTADEIAEGIVEVCRRVREKAPAAKIVLMDVFPRGAKDSSSRRDVARVNAALGPRVTALADENLVRLNLWDRFVGADGEIPKDLMFDALHPTAKGYDLWGKALQDVLEE